MPLGLDPVVQERRLELVDDRALHAKVRVAPVVLVLGVAQPLVGHADTAGESYSPVHDQQLAMGAVVEPVDRVPAERPIQHDLHAGVPHLLENVTVGL